VTTDPRHLALVLSDLGGGGAQRRMLTLARAFADRGHRVDVVVTSSEGPFRTELSPAVRLVPLASRGARLRGIASRRGPRVLASFAALARYFATERPDAVLSTSNPANLACLWARTRARVSLPVVVSVNVHLSAATGERQRAWGPLLRTLVRRAYAKADAIVANSQGVADDLVRSASVPPERIAVIHNPVDVTAIRERAREPVEHPWTAPGGPPLVLAVGKLKLQKDFPTLLRAFARVRAAQPARLVILGEGEERHRLERLARELGVAADAALPGFVTNPFAWMARAAVLVHPSAWEGFSNVLCEALACGCPVVSTDCPGGSGEILDHGAIGPLVPVGDDRALADAILALLSDPPDPERLRARVARFSVDAAVDRYLDVVLGACGGVPRSDAAPSRAESPSHA
jgi:glycosyltransferase involved in cell wall biosynthesis